MSLDDAQRLTFVVTVAGLRHVASGHFKDTYEHVARTWLAFGSNNFGWQVSPELPGVGCAWRTYSLKVMAPLPIQETPSPSFDARPKIRIVTECSGLEPLPYVLDRLGLTGGYSMVAACEIDPHCRRVVRLCHKGDARPTRMFKDISRRRPEQLPDHDLYVAGFPCQPFSTMGSRRGERDERGRGRIIDHIIAALATKKPRAFLLENVKGLVTQHRATFDRILRELRLIGDGAYSVGYNSIDTADHGLPQHPECVYIVGFLRSSLVHVARFEWPEPCRCKPLPKVLRWSQDDHKIKSKALHKEKAFLAKASPKVKQRLLSALERIRKKGLDPRDLRRPIVVDIDASQPRWMHGIAPCLTRARAATGHYLPARGRRLTLKERLRLQGLPVPIHDLCDGHVSDLQLGAMIGNSLSLNVLEALLSKMLPACGLMP